ncbi:hypothetical protein N7537_008156 [Penicillium hordei]|uniref:Uncharacterized protein n=1 Tax=Penicillium hordei TaxID=40994 RepID=A0AAD6DZU7_9EURO|nr:uncharacterized protein N7537_008156 [Penicillium hordei]KAJ5598072.1 hypothetical protein N7537_008156 [Penicillium hordei]
MRVLQSQTYVTIYSEHAAPTEGSSLGWNPNLIKLSRPSGRSLITDRKLSPWAIVKSESLHPYHAYKNSGINLCVNLFVPADSELTGPKNATVVGALIKGTAGHKESPTKAGAQKDMDNDSTASSTIRCCLPLPG